MIGSGSASMIVRSIRCCAAMRPDCRRSCRPSSATGRSSRPARAPPASPQPLAAPARVAGLDPGGDGLQLAQPAVRQPGAGGEAEQPAEHGRERPQLVEATSTASSDRLPVRSRPALSRRSAVPTDGKRGQCAIASGGRRAKRSTRRSAARPVPRSWPAISSRVTPGASSTSLNAAPLALHRRTRRAR